ncbi:MAG: hypothetical protein ABJB11_16560 [Ferruginibacter sp.]
MKRLIKIFLPFNIFYLSGIFFCSAYAQGISGDTIFVNTEAEINLQFPSRPTSFYTNPKNAPYDLRSLNNGLTITAKSENTKTAILSITENKRTHSFFLAYKKIINYDIEAELFYDYSTEKKLSQHLKETAARILQNAPAIANDKLNTETENATSGTSSVTDKQSASYYALLEEGDKNIRIYHYDKAKENFEEASKLRPEDPIPQQRLEEIKTKQADKNQLNEQEKINQYTTLTGQAKAFFDLKKYAESRDLYKKALNLRPNDLYATNQLEKIDKIINGNKGKQEEQRLKELYNGYINTGEKSLGKNLLSEARIAFEQALVIKPDDPLAINKIKIITEKEKVVKEALDRENNYNDIIQNADKLFTKGDYEGAKDDYNKALVIFKRPWPQEQLANIKKIKSDIAENKIAEEQKQVREAEEQKRKQQLQELETKYYGFVNESDKLFQAGNYEEAKTGYNMALHVIDRPWPKDQIIKIDNILREQSQRAITEKQEKEARELEEKYAVAIASADNYFRSADYSNAKAAYLQAKVYFARPWPKEQLENIERLIKEQIVAEKAEKERLAQEAKTTAQYNSLIQKADAAFDKSNYQAARKLYSSANLLKPMEQYPQERIEAIQTALDLIAKLEKERKDSIAAVEITNAKYNLALSKGKSFYLKADYENAKEAFEEAISLKPGTTELLLQLAKTSDKLEEIRKEQELTEKYESKLGDADSLMAAREYELAVVAFNDAHTLKPTDPYPTKQVKYLKAEIVIQQRKKDQQDKIDAFNRSKSLISLADKAVKEENFELASQYYTEALQLQPGNQYVTDRLKIVKYQIEVRKPAFPEKPKSEKPFKKEGSNFWYQEEAIPYTTNELKIKYPSIDFATPLKENFFNEYTFNVKENADFILGLKDDKPRLNISDKENKMKLICEDIRVKNKNIYIKLLIQNNSNKDDFLTGVMMLTWIKNIGSRIKLSPVFIYPSVPPVVKSKNELTLIYVCKAYNISNEDKFIFNLTDRTKSIGFELNLDNALFTKELVQ